MKYKIVRGTSDNELKERVNKELSEGWALQGGVAVESSTDVFLQAMVLNDTKSIGATGPQ